MRRTILILVGALIVILIAIQLVPVDRSNPPVVADFEEPPAVRAVLRASCYDCHSHETSWPWYSRVAPVSWLVAHDIEEGRDHLNFSMWGSYDQKRRAKLAEEMWEEVEEGAMPLKMYLLAHPDARLSEAAKATLRDWSLASHGSGS
ncbi:MAG TPA: heme-binding domain-containing protein [Thermoanaerobaculales bacterium]|nr:heme-binding domain-containing protein [Thermoanaerobaculales bacterium]HPA82399.1 heme-binding domain-containing protein [Thermoanaerobaculales bacterium]HQL29207.1 heme-binding domain-containing protein [Thermoanaerobaculales bacterium]HQN95623.1 heme-binding domain-containing protein [Thermoanaerobaculales bacterium]HQP43580.1 heme-binding domain-containing protein [Thermoanaerobaculales bacterium]